MYAVIALYLPFAKNIPLSNKLIQFFRSGFDYEKRESKLIVSTMNST